MIKMTKKNVVTDMLERSGVVSASNQRKKPWPKKGGKVKWSPEKFKRCEEAVGDSVKGLVLHKKKRVVYKIRDISIVKSS